jgi:hypothetical protein
MDRYEFLTYAMQCAWFDLCAMMANHWEGDYGARSVAYENSLSRRGLIAQDPVDTMEDRQ